MGRGRRPDRSHLKIIFDVNLFFLQDVERRWPGDRDRLRRMSIIEEGPVQKVRGVQRRRPRRAPPPL